MKKGKKLLVFIFIIMSMLLVSCTEDTEEHEHNYNEWIEENPATCSEEGVLGHYHCDGCGKDFDINKAEILSLVIPAKGHSFSSEWTYDETNHWHECACGEKSEVVAHTYGAWTIIEDSTEDKIGSKKQVCSVCGYDDIVEIPKKGHSFSSEWTYDETNHWHECACGEKSEVVAHTYGTWIIIEDSTEDKIGSKKQVCSVCGYEDIVEIPKKGHSFSSEWTYDETNHWHECACGEKSEVVAHTFNEGIISKNPTCTSKGEKTYTCNCGYSYVELLDMVDHEYVDEECIYCHEAIHYSEGLEFTLLSDNTYEVSGVGDCTDSKIYIPKTYNDIPVTSIGDGAFARQISGDGNIQSIVLPSTIKNIGYYAFASCYNLNNIVLPEGLTTIGEEAFSYCFKLNSLVIPSTVISIGDKVFSSCLRLVEVYNLSNVTLTEDILTDSIIYSIHTSLDEESIINTTNEGYVYAVGDNKYYIIDYVGKETSLVLPETINDNPYELRGTFAFNEKIESIVIPNIFKQIDAMTFSYCINLESITFEDGQLLTSIGDYAMFFCTKLYNVKLPNSLSIIGENVFGGCISLKQIDLPNSLKEIGNQAFIISGLVTVVIPEGVISIDAWAFYQCNRLVSVTIPSTINSIGERAFDGCEKLVEVYNLSSLDITIGSYDNGYIGYYAKVIHTSLEEESNIIRKDDYVFLFDNNDYYLVGYEGNNTELVLPESINNHKYSLYEKLFYSDTNIKSVTISNGITRIPEFAFCECSNLYEVILPNSIISIESAAFYNCTNLTYINIPEKLEFIGVSAFYECDKIENMTIDEYGKYLGDENNPYKFLISGESITDIVIPKEVKIIALAAYNYCYNLTNVYYNGTIEDWCNIIICSIYDRPDFDFNVSITTNPMYYASNFYIIDINGDTVYNGNTYSLVTEILIPEGMTSIVDYQFEGFNNVTSITIPNSVTSIGSYAFGGCSELISIEIPNSVTSIGNYAFEICSSLKNVYYNGTIEDWCKITFSSSFTNPMYYASNFYIIDANGDTVYNGNTYSLVTEIEIPNTITSIGDYQFCGFNNVTSIAIPNSVTSIGGYAFSGCSKLESIIIPAGVTSIGSYAFNGCSNLKRVYYEGILSDWNNISINSNYNSNLTSAIRYYYSESEPTTDGNYWHYDSEGNIVIW
ncbi:MAG: leucine-rich repeat domain-containing protein [Anaeroplasmataceae bacterium]